MLKMRRVKKYFGIFKDAGVAFIDDNGIKLSAALSYYTIFSIGPLLVIVISLSGLFFGQDAVRGRLFGQIEGLVGPAAALQIQEIIKNIQGTETGTIGTIIGAIILVIGATGIFTEIQDSINFIWSLRAKPKRGIIKLLINRLLSFSLIISLGFLLLVSLVVSALMDC
jgi:membrane protein